MSPTPLFPGGLTNSIPELSSFPPHRDKNTLLTKDYQSLENKDYKNGKLKRTVSRDFLLLLFAWFSPIWIPYLYNKVHYMINMVSISKCKTLTHNYSITFKGFFFFNVKRQFHDILDTLSFRIKTHLNPRFLVLYNVM